MQQKRLHSRFSRIGRYAGRACGRGQCEPVVAVVVRRHRRVQCNVAAARYRAHVGGLGGEGVGERPVDPHILRNQVESDQRARQSLGTDDDRSGAGVEHDVPFGNPGGRHGVPEANLASGQRHAAGINKRAAVHRNAIRIGQYDIRARADYIDLSADNTGIGTGYLIDNRSRINTGVIQRSTGGADVKTAIGVIRNTCNGRCDIDGLMVIRGG